MSEIFSFNNVMVSNADRVKNGPVTGSRSITIIASNMGSVTYTGAGRGGHTGCEATEWESETSVRCQAGLGARGSGQVSLTAGGQGGAGSRSEAVSWDGPGVYTLSLGEDRRARFDRYLLSFSGLSYLEANLSSLDTVLFTLTLPSSNDYVALIGGQEYVAFTCVNSSYGLYLLRLTARGLFGTSVGDHEAGAEVIYYAWKTVGQGNRAGTGSTSMTVYGGAMGVGVHGGRAGRAHGGASYDGGWASGAGRANGAGTGSTSMTVYGGAMGLGTYTGAGRGGHTGCEATEWESETSVRCQAGLGARGSGQVSLTAGGQGGAGSRSEAVSWDGPGVYTLSLGEDRRARFDRCNETGADSSCFLMDTIDRLTTSISSSLSTNLSRLSFVMSVRQMPPSTAYVALIGGQEYVAFTCVNSSYSPYLLRLTARGLFGTSVGDHEAGAEVIYYAWKTVGQGNRAGTGSTSMTVYGGAMGLGTYTGAGRGGHTGGSGTEGASYDGGWASGAGRANGAGTGSTSMTVYGGGMGLGTYTGAGRGGHTGCEATEWESETSVTPDVKVHYGRQYRQLNVKFHTALALNFVLLSLLVPLLAALLNFYHMNLPWYGVCNRCTATLLYGLSIPRVDAPVELSITGNSNSLSCVDDLEWRDSNGFGCQNYTENAVALARLYQCGFNGGIITADSGTITDGQDSLVSPGPRQVCCACRGSHYVFECAQGYMQTGYYQGGEAVCEDINECALGPACNLYKQWDPLTLTYENRRGQCENTIGSYICTCPAAASVCSDIAIKSAGSWALVEEALDGTTIYVSPGLYEGVCGSWFSRNITIVGIDGAANTVIDCNLQSSFATIHHATVTLQGLTIRNGSNASEAGCLFASHSSVTLIDVVLERCSISSSSALSMMSSSLAMIGVTLDSSQDSYIADLRLENSYASMQSSRWKAGLYNLAFYLVQSELNLSNFSVQNETFTTPVAMLINSSTIWSDSAIVVFDNSANVTEWCTSITDQQVCAMFACCSWDGYCGPSGNGVPCSDCTSSNLCTKTTGSACKVMGFTFDNNLLDSQCVWKY
ncbi:hypothetical protein GUITHDRAFT_146364 [Guillardia theta CCMP2712]|uniref:Uncharacterized protein n=1 Tax=Guillardia theta (strain CCMP2712) TaxID=905079 RepID=L1II57_GUITC|nr:hypothetical protein GUITHDRAFT_146364 [Guillardia theta CCMP2712]EKX35629.1 hypothetical protein GUITHDRAFT_146364 [Guillardia theta CCMP2712]|eukprot:XP_005822609.1 hypothetical protein GUITHDRAFT_146364 [Guillardia theta CCMP2712]